MNRSLIAPLLITLSACNGGGGDTSTTDTCPINGTVPASMRDVERDAEGVSYSVFGEYPTRAPDWTRAAGVLSLLHTVWDTAKADCPALPATGVTAVDDAISRLDTTIPAQDQQAAALAGNDVHMQMAALFAYYNPDVPVEVVRMDAVFLRAGIHAHFGDWTAFGDDVTSLQADWATVKSTATSKVPACHRVAGTESVVGDLDQTLAQMVAAQGSSDAAIAETEADAGLLEVDILELLFDCPPDGTAPTTGVGAACSKDGDCDGTNVCDLDNQGGRCAPDPTTTNVGTGCTTTADCGTDPRDACNNEVGDGYPGGYCVMEPCDDVQVCSPGATCIAMPFETPACMQSCVADTDCRASEGYVCQLFPTTPPFGFGPSDHACAFACTTDEDCSSPLKCDVGSGKCTP